eukprot:evm.model.scf_365.5 EVM.evm.TU.scf_365.5   scf_365:75709-82248(+)
MALPMANSSRPASATGAMARRRAARSPDLGASIRARAPGASHSIRRMPKVLSHSRQDGIEASGFAKGHQWVPWAWAQVPAQNTLRPSRLCAAEGEAGATSNYTLFPVLCAVTAAALGAFLFGYHLGVVNGPLEAIAADLGFAGDAVRQGLVVSSVLGGAAVGSICGGGLADMLGRKMALVLDTLFLVGGTLLSATAGTLQAMVLGRLITGVGIGVSSACVPLYISEVAPTAIRGALGSVNQLAICLGILGALVANVIIAPAAWRTLFALGAIPALALAVGMLLSPESPRWLMGKGNSDGARSAQQWLWGSTDDSLGGADEGESKGSAGFGALFQKKYAPIVLTGCLLLLFQQWSGVNAIVYFSTKVFQEAGVANGTLASAAVGATNVLGTILATSVIDAMGRKQLLRWSFVGMGLSMLVMAAGLSWESLKALSGTLALGGTLAYILCFGLGVGPVPALIVPEMNPAEVRGLAMSAAMCTHWVTNLALGQLFLPGVSAVGVPAVYTFFAAVCFVAVLFTNAFVPETKGKSLEQIEKGV